MFNTTIRKDPPTPLYDLFEKFPTVPRTTIIKLDVLNQGIRYTPILNWIGRWTLPWTLRLGTIALGDISKEAKTEEVTRSSQEDNLLDIPVDIPSFMSLRDGTISQLFVKSDAPYEIRYEGDGTYMLYWNGIAVEEVLFAPRPAWLSKRLKDGTPLPLVLSPIGDIHTCTLPPTSWVCVFATKDEICWFCPVDPGKKALKEMGIDKPVPITPEKVVEALTIVREEMYERGRKYLEDDIPCGQNNCRCLNWLISGGSLYDQEKEAERYIPFVEAVRQALPEYNTYVETQACSPRSAEKLAKAGLHGIQYNIEVWDKKMFYITCPGKAKNITWERWTEWLAEAVPFYERGHVVSNQVLGLELQPPDGFKSLEEGFESVMEGHEWMTRHGIAPSWTPFMNYAGTKIENSPCPPTEYYLQVGIETHKLMLQHKLYTPTRFFFCYRCGIVMGGSDFARQRWGKLKYNEYCDPCMIPKKEEVKEKVEVAI